MGLYTPTEPELDDINRRFYDQPAIESQAGRHISVQDFARNLAGIVLENAPACRERAIAIDKCEEVVMWFDRALSNNEVAPE